MPDEKRPTQPIVVKDAPELQKVYCNYINITWNAFDVRFHFGDTEVLQDAQGNVNVDRKVVVTVAWNEAKQISELLAQLIQAYEQQNGQITRPGDVMIPSV